MNVSETLSIISALKGCGATHFKSQDFEISLVPGMSVPSEQPPIPKVEPAPQPVQAAMQENTEATEKLKHLIKTMSLPPEELADVIFPAGAGG